MLIAATTCDLLTQNFLTLAAQAEQAGFTSLLGFTFIVYSFLADIIIFKEEMKPLSIAGATMCFVTTFGVAAYKLCEARIEAKRISKVSNA